MRFRAWNVRSFSRAGLLESVAREMAKYKLDLEGFGLVLIQQTIIHYYTIIHYTFFYGNGNVNHHTGTRSFVQKRIISVGKRVSYIIGHRVRCFSECNAPPEDESDYTMDSFYVELLCAFDEFPNYHIKILLGDFNAKIEREGIFKRAVGSENLHEISNDNGVRIINFVTSKI
jgi:hypothetical protein